MSVTEVSQDIPQHGPNNRWSGLRKRLRQSRTAWLYILPAGLVMLFITLLPQLYQVWMSFTDYRIKNLRFLVFDSGTWEKYAPTYVGLDNYIKILTNSMAIENYDFWPLLLINIVWTVSNVDVHVILGVYIYLAIDNNALIGNTLYRVISILPWAISGYLISSDWRHLA